MYLAYLALLVTTIIWAAAVPIIKLTLQYIPVYTFLFYRFLIVCLVLLPIILIELKKNPIDKRDYLNLILLGISAQASLVFVFEGLKYTSSLDTAVIGIMAPILSVAAGHYFFKEKVNRGVKIGVILATLGTFVVILEPLFANHSGSGDAASRLWGNFLILAYNIFFLFYIIWSKISLGQNSALLKKTLSFINLKPFKKTYSAFMLTAITFYVAFACFIPLALLEKAGVIGNGVYFDPGTLPLTPILGVIYMALLSSIVAYVLFQWALRTASVGDTAIYSYLGPIFTVPFAYILLAEKPTPFMYIGSFIIAVGVIIAERKKA